MSGPEKKPKPAAFVLLAFLAAAAIFAAFQLDGPVRDRVLAMQGKGWKKSETRASYGAVSKYGDWPELMVLGAAGWLVAWRLRNRDWQRILVTSMVASTVAGALVNTLRLTTGHTRQNAGSELVQGWYGPFHDGRLTIGNSKYNSFPSGHTATAVGFAAVIFFARPLSGSLALFVALGIGWSRIALGAHHFSDVVVAAIIAFFIAWVAWRIAVRRGDEIAAWFAQRFRRKS
jgi:membrane-associated phospholipid phosphatase